MNSKLKFPMFVVLPVMVFLLPLVTHAEAFFKVRELVVSAGNIINLCIKIVAALALLFFFWGLAKFILNAGSEEGQEQGKQIMKWGIVALFVMVSIWGIVKFLNDQLDIRQDLRSPTVPGFNQGFIGW